MISISLIDIYHLQLPAQNDLKYQSFLYYFENEKSVRFLPIATCRRFQNHQHSSNIQNTIDLEGRCIR